jgi:competence protein ComEC
VVGDVSRLDPAVRESFQRTGLTHLTAVSGSNCAIVSGAVLLLCRVLRAGPVTSALMAALGLAGFVVLARPEPSVLRAAVMGGVALVALGAGRPRAALPALAAAVGVLLLINPELARSPGFALSVLATSGLLLIAPGWRDGLRRGGVPAGAAEALAVPAAAQVACAPVIAAIGGGVGLLTVPANLLAIPAVAPATVLGVSAALASAVSPPVAAILAWLASWPTWYLVQVARIGAGLPDNTLPWPTGIAGGLALAGLLAGLGLAGRVRMLRLAAAVVVAVLVLVALPLRTLAPGWPPPGWLLVGCSVGQGDALVLRAGPGSAVVIDAGPDPAPVDGCLRRLRIRSIPLFVISHLHADHVGGAEGVLRGRTVGAVLVGQYTEPESGRTLLAEATRRAAVPMTITAAGASYQVGDLRLEVVWPTGSYRGTRSDPNNNSLVLRVTSGGVSILLTGDVEREAEQGLMAAGVPLQADVLKVPHHGSSHSTPEFLDRVRPRIGIVEVGAGNDYGHPSQATITRLRRIGARILRTDTDGDVAVVIRDHQLGVAVRGVPSGSPDR